MKPDTTPFNPGIVAALSRVMEDVGAVRKGDRNTHQNFNFRGIDAVVNAVSPALRKHGIVVTPQVLDYQYETVQVGNPAKNMASVRVMVRYTFHASDGSSIETVVPAESFDSGDKATAKAMSVAFRTALLQTLCLPTDETDPDAQSYERANHPTAHTPAPRKATGPVKEPGEPAPVINIGDGGASQAQIGTIKKLVRECNLESAKEVASNVTGRTISSATDLTKAEASAVIKELLAMKEALS
jgi:hypothetical protein